MDIHLSRCSKWWEKKKKIQHFLFIFHKYKWKFNTETRAKPFNNVFPAMTSIQWGTEVEAGGTRRVVISYCSRWAIKKHLNYEHWRMKKISTRGAGWQLVLIKSCGGQGKSWPGHRYSDIARELCRLTVGRATKLWAGEKQEADTDGPRVTSVNVGVVFWIAKQSNSELNWREREPVCMNPGKMEERFQNPK